MGEKTIFTLAAVLMALYFWLSNFDRFYFGMHFVQAAFYLIVLLLLYYGLEEWAYVMAIVAPLLWLVEAWLLGILGAGLRGLGGLAAGQGFQNPVDVVGGLVFLVSLALMVVSAALFKRDIWGRPGVLRSTIGAILVVGLYNAALAYIYYRISTP
ncbi:MAG TPA: hypothetical protein VNN18_03420 [Candidatus Xenobia bacterium]|nr:hypothetical protein [Candidatus Xenobia bacterium]